MDSDEGLRRPPYKKRIHLDEPQQRSRDEAIPLDDEINAPSRSTQKLRAMQKGSPGAAGQDDSHDALMIPRPPKKSGSQTDAIHLGTSPADQEEAEGGRDGVLSSHTGLRSKQRASVKDTETGEALPKEKQFTSKPKFAKGTKSKTPGRSRKKKTGTNSSKKAPVQNPCAQGTSRGLVKGRISKAVCEGTASLERSAVKVAQLSVAVFLGPQVLSGLPAKVGSKAPFKLTQEQFMRGSKPGSSGTQNFAPKKTLTPRTDYTIDVDEYEREGDILPPISHKGATVVKKKSTPSPRSKTARRGAENPLATLPALPDTSKPSEPNPKRIVGFNNRDWAPK